MIPEKTWNAKDNKELEQVACELGDRIADWVEQALEWAQRICNGESWEELCNKRDTANWYRVVRWKNGRYRQSGGSYKFDLLDRVAVIHEYDTCDDRKCWYVVPLIVLYDKC